MNKKILKLKSKTIAFIDWANVYNWKKSLKKEVDPQKLFKYLKTYKEIKEIRFYFGADQTHPASNEFLKEMRKIGYSVTTKPVKFLKVYNEEKTEFIWKRKCDFDLEIGLDAYESLDKFGSFIFFSGDGDFATLYTRLIKRKKQVIVIYAHGNLGREVWQIKKGIFKKHIKKLGVDLFIKKMPPHRRRGARISKLKHK